MILYVAMGGGYIEALVWYQTLVLGSLPSIRVERVYASSKGKGEETDVW